MVQTAKVLSVNGDTCEIEVSRKAMCDGCHKSDCGGGCPMSGLFSSGGKMVASAVNSANAEIGDTVEIETSDREVLSAALLVFILPVILGIASYFIACNFTDSSGIRTLFAVIGFVLPFPFLRIVEKNLKSSSPKLTVKRVINNASESSD